MVEGAAQGAPGSAAARHHEPMVLDITRRRMVRAPEGVRREFSTANAAVSFPDPPLR